MKAQVTAAIIVRDDGSILLCRRQGGPLHGLWEFPGGKIEGDESPEECLKRECLEELEICLAIDRVYARTIWQAEGQELKFFFFLSHIEEGQPRPKVHSELRWIHPRDFGPLPFCPADQPIARRLTAQAAEERC